MNVLIIGSGGREHAIAWKIAQSKKLTKLYIAPGNAGTNGVAENVAINVSDFAQIKSFVLSNNIDLVIVGPEQPLVDGVVDYFKQEDALKEVSIVGPDQKGATLEGSKDFAKEFMQKNNIPTAKYGTFDANTIEQAYSFLDELKAPYVLKADGLAAGKGVVILQDKEEAKSELKAMFDGKFGSAGDKVVIEEFLDGIELSVFVVTDGKNYVILPEAKDYKKIGEGDTGLNTGGMGSVSPVPFADSAFMDKVEQKVVVPTIKGLQNADYDYTGFVFIGLMKIGDEPFVIEYNVRMGDPETQVVMPRIKSDLLEMFSLIKNQELDKYRLEIDEQAATTVVLVSGGYPGSYEKGKVISGLDTVEGSVVFHAGTAGENEITTNGGRVLNITSFGKDFKEALQKSYLNADKISYEGKYNRTDIGFDL